MSYGVVTHGTSFAYYRCFSHVLLKSVSQSDTESGVHFLLSPFVQKLVYRRIGLFVSLRGQSHVGGPHGLSPAHLHIVAT